MVIDRNKPKAKLQHVKQTTPIIFLTLHGLTSSTYLSQYYSPEQINGRLKVLGWTDVPSIETIYQHIYADKAQGGTSHRYLRSQKIYRKRGYKANDRRGQIANRKDISERPVIIEQRQRLGDYEGDTVVGKGHQGVLVP